MEPEQQELELPAEPAEPAAEAPASEPAPEWAGPSQQEWEQTQQYLAATAPFMEQVMQYAQQQPQQYEDWQEPPQYDPEDPSTIQGYVDEMVNRGVQSALGPFQPLLGSIAEQEGERVARSHLEQLSQQIGPFDQDQAILVTQAMMANGWEPDQALSQAAQYVHGYEKQIADKAVEAYKEQLRNAASAPQGSPGQSGAADETLGVPQGRDRYEEAVSRYLSSRNPVMP